MMVNMSTTTKLAILDFGKMAKNTFFSNCSVYRTHRGLVVLMKTDIPDIPDISTDIITDMETDIWILIEILSWAQLNFSWLTVVSRHTSWYVTDTYFCISIGTSNTYCSTWPKPIIALYIHSCDVMLWQFLSDGCLTVYSFSIVLLQLYYSLLQVYYRFTTGLWQFTTMLLQFTTVLLTVALWDEELLWCALA